jgi:hypothetical protein
VYVGPRHRSFHRKHGASPAADQRCTSAHRGAVSYSNRQLEAKEKELQHALKDCTENVTLPDANRSSCAHCGAVFVRTDRQLEAKEKELQQAEQLFRDTELERTKLMLELGEQQAGFRKDPVWSFRRFGHAWHYERNLISVYWSLFEGLTSFEMH